MGIEGGVEEWTISGKTGMEGVWVESRRAGWTGKRYWWEWKEALVGMKGGAGGNGTVPCADQDLGLASLKLHDTCRKAVGHRHLQAPRLRHAMVDTCQECCLCCDIYLPLFV